MLSPFHFRDCVLRYAIAIVFVSSVFLTAPVVGQIDPETRPRTQELLPETTVMFLQIDDFQDMMTKIAASSGGQMWQDESIAPLMEGLWDEAKSAYGDVRDQVGVDLEDFTALPSGEMTFAIIAPRRKDPVFMLILELDNENEAVDRVLDRGRQLIQEDAGVEIISEETDDGIDFETVNLDEMKMKFFQKDGLLVGCAAQELENAERELDEFVDRWMDREVDKVRPLTQNRKFVTIMNRCVGSKDAKPEARFFVDPITMIKSFNRTNVAVTAVMNGVLPVIGVDGLLGIGGSMLLAEEEFESVVHGHILLANPRAGVFEMISLKPTNYVPEPWLPADVTTYMTTSWDVEQMLAELTKMIENFQEEGAVDEWIENNINQEIEMDLREDILAHLTGRVTLVQWMEPPMRINSQVTLLAVELRDAEAFEKSLDAVVDRLNRSDDEDADNDNRIEETDYKGIRIWAQPLNQIEDRMERQRQRREERGDDSVQVDINIPQPAFALVGDYFLISPQSRTLIEHAIDTDQGDFDPLANDDKYQIIAKKMTRMLKTDMPCVTMYQNPEESFRMILELANSENTSQLLTGAAENNKYMAGLKSRLDENPLPSFDSLKNYIRPSGAFGVTDDTGYHFLVFNLRADPEEEGASEDDN